MSTTSASQQAWCRLFEWHFDAVHRFCLTLTDGHRDLAEEVSQQTFVTAARHICRFRPEQATFRAWLHGIARKRYLALTAKEQRRRRHETLPRPVVRSDAREPLAEDTDMASHDIDKLIEQSFSGDPPDPAFREHVLRDSTALLLHARRRRIHRRWVATSVAAAFIVAASFVVGRYSISVTVTHGMAEPGMANDGERVTVPRELVDWLEAANLFRQVGIPDRMELAVSRAGRLLPGGVIAGETNLQERAGTDRPDVSAPEPMFETMNRIMAQSLGD